MPRAFSYLRESARPQQGRGLCRVVRDRADVPAGAGVGPRDAVLRDQEHPLLRELLRLPHSGVLQQPPPRPERPGRGRRSGGRAVPGCHVPVRETDVVGRGARAVLVSVFRALPIGGIKACCGGCNFALRARDTCCRPAAPSTFDDMKLGEMLAPCALADHLIVLFCGRAG